MDIFKVALVFYFIVLSVFPFNTTLTNNFYDDSRLLSIISLFFITTLTCITIVRRFNLEAKKNTVTSLNFCFLGLTLTIISNQDANTIINSISIFLFIAFSISLKPHANTLKYLFLVISIISATLITKCYLYLIFCISIDYFNDPILLIEKFDNIRFFNQFQLFALVCTLALLKHQILTRLAYYNLFSQLLFLFLTGGRGATLSWLVVVGLLFIAKPHRTLAVTALKFTFAAFVAFLLANYLLTLNLSNVYLLRASTSLRAEMWLEALNALSWSNIFYGYGGGNYGAHTTLSAMSHPHNLIIQYISEWGGIFTIGFFSLVLIALKKNIGALFSEERNYTAFILLGFVAVLINAQFDGTFHNPVGQFLSFTFFGLLLNSNYNRANGKGTVIKIELSLAPRIFLALLLFGLAVIYVWLCWLYFLQVQSNPAPFYGGPYFWLTGEPFRFNQ